MKSRHLGKGFTLIELMITVAIVAILAAIAYPSYTEQVARSRRNDAKSVLLEAAQWSERQYTVGNTYAVTLRSDLGRSPKGTGTKLYDIAYVTSPAASAPSGTGFFLQATPTTGNPMASDKCGSFIVSNTGGKTLSGNATGTDVALCWDR